MPMQSTAEVWLWGTHIGAVAWNHEQGLASFAYTDKFLQAPVELSPIHMPRKSEVYSFPELNKQTFKGLPGLLSDSLPDKFGNTLIDQWLVLQGKSRTDFNAVDRLCYIGNRGMGALEFKPSITTFQEHSNKVYVADMVELASQILSKRKQEQYAFSDSEIENQQALSNILQIGTSAGGARAKAVIAWNEKSNEVRSGQVQHSGGFSYWLLKFDGVSDNSDKELNDPKGFGRIEYAYYLMAKEAGISMSECRLFEENGRAHFMTKRFDREDDGRKLHMQSLCALGHYDFNMAGAYSYEQAFDIIKRLRIDNTQRALEEQFRRMVFNIVTRNQDDHTKNIAFLMDRQGAWSLSPAFDVCYSYNPDGEWTSKHQMSVNMKRDNFEIDDLVKAGEEGNLRSRKAKSIIREVIDAAKQWPKFAEEARVSEEMSDVIAKTHRVSLLDI